MQGASNLHNEHDRSPQHRLPVWPHVRLGMYGVLQPQTHIPGLHSRIQGVVTGHVHVVRWRGHVCSAQRLVAARNTLPDFVRVPCSILIIQMGVYSGLPGTQRLSHHTSPDAPPPIADLGVRRRGLVLGSKARLCGTAKHDHQLGHCGQLRSHGRTRRPRDVPNQG